jgi:hypothetical protein
VISSPCGNRPGHALIGDEVHEQHADQRDHRSHRQFNAAGDDDESLTDRRQAEQPDEIRGIGDIDRQQKARVQNRHDRADSQDQDEKEKVFLVHAVPAGSNVLPIASNSTFSSLN